MDIIQDRLDVIEKLKSNLFNKKNEIIKKRDILVKYLERFLFLEDGNLNLKYLFDKIKETITALKDINGKTSIEGLLVLNSDIEEIISSMQTWLSKISLKINEIKKGNEHLKRLPVHSNKNRFYVMIKELNLNKHILKHPINEVQYSYHIKRDSEDLMKYYNERERAFLGERVFSKDDSSLYPGSILRIKGGHHRTFELYRRYLQGRIDGNRMIEFIVEH